MAAIPPVDYARLKLLCILEGPGAAVLRFILKCLTKLPDNWMANFCKLSNTQQNNKFKKTEINQINADPTWTTFDISLLYKVIRFACEKVKKDDDSLRDLKSWEGLIREIKEERNTFVHERPQLSDKEFEVKVNQLKVLFEKALGEAQKSYNVPNQEITQEKSRIEGDIKDILRCFTVEAILKLDIGKGLPVFKKMLDTRLRDIYERSQILDPLCFLSGISKKDFNVQDIFTQISIEKESIEVNYVDILVFTRSLGQQSQPYHTTQPLQLTHPQLLLIKGVAGSGKTTLLTFILSEWLKDECDCRINHLNQYDLILHIVCRESNCNSLEQFLEQVLPETKAFRPHTMTLLRECKLLFLIDGLDERNNSSRELVIDILRQCEMLPTCTIICSSRPGTAVDFYHSVSNKYRKGEGIMKGISLKKRTKLVLQHYDSLGTKSVSDRDRLKQVMKKIGWRDHFGLPLNLLFLATLFHEHPYSVRENTTQIKLYIATHDWSIDKLQYRLAEHSQTKHLSRLDRKESIEKVLDLMYQVALGGLLHNRMFLSAEDMSQLRECCKEQNLPREEMLGAFFSLRETRVGIKVHVSYCTPHKGLQEYLAAKYVMHILEFSPEKSLRQLLLEPTKETLQTLRNFLLHVAGLISQPGVKCSYKVIQEVVDLLQESGMKRCGHWLSLLENTEVNRTTLECVARHITKDNNEEVSITDSTIISAMELLPLIPSKTLNIRQVRKELDVDVHQFGRNCAHHTLRKVSQQHHYKHPTQETNSDSLLRAITRSHLKEFLGHLSVNGLALLPPCLEMMCLAVHSNHHCHSIITAITSTHKTLLPHLESLDIHVRMAMIEAGLPRVPLPDLPGVVRLSLSGVEKTNIQKVCQVCVALQPESAWGYTIIAFPLAKMEGFRDWRDLLHQLKEHKVRVGRGVVVPPRTCTEEEKKELNRLTQAWLGCRFGRVKFDTWDDLKEEEDE